MVKLLNKDSVKHIKEPKYGELFRELPVFRWLEAQNELSDDQMLALLTNLAPLGEEGKAIANVFLEKHNHKADLDNLFEKCRGKPIATYESFAFLGYTGYMPGKYDSPVDELQALKKSKDRENRGLYYSEKGQLRINANTFASYVLSRFDLVYVLTQGFYIYESTGRWRKIEELELEKLCREILHEAEEGIWRQAWHGEYMAALRLEAKQVSEMDQKHHFINLKNGMLHLPSLELVPHDPSYYSTVQNSINYNPSATCPKFEAFLGSIFENDKERISLVQEVMGYVLTKDRRLQKAFIFYGVGANGKSVLADVIGKLAGAASTAHVPLSKLMDRFGLDNLPGKTVNISTENELGEKHLNTQNFKAITGADTVNVEQKYKDSFSCQLYCKLLILVNSLPRTKDHSHGYYRRLVIVPFNKVFTEAEQDRDLLSKLLPELEGILLFALQGYQRLLRNNHQLSACKQSDLALAAYKEEQNPVLTFIQEELRYPAESSIKRSELHPAFRNWALRNGYDDFSGISRQKFWDLFRAGGTELGLALSTKKIKGDVYLENLEFRGFQDKSSLDLFG